MVALTSPDIWILARASGMVAVLALTCSVVAGLLISGRPLGRKVHGGSLLELHRLLSLVGLVAIAVHGSALVLDTTVHISAWALVLPGASSYRPLWVGAGVIAAELALALQLSFRLRGRIGVRRWRQLHMSSFGAWLLAMSHGLLSGTDSARPWVQAAYVAATGLVAALLAWRVQASSAKRAARGARGR